MSEATENLYNECQILINQFWMLEWNVGFNECNFSIGTCRSWLISLPGCIKSSVRLLNLGNSLKEKLHSKRKKLIDKFSLDISSIPKPRIVTVVVSGHKPQFLTNYLAMEEAG